ncbi:Hypothetical protein A7982_09912 [Minicystis rosea]|nr:Hypothetical protein A7982_09912 [Minicystis rosea]
MRYDLRFTSGGMGICDRLHIALPCAPEEVDAIVARLGLVSPEVAVADERWGAEIAWLVSDEDEPRPLHAAVVAFVAAKRAELQPLPDEHARVWLAPASGVNAWTLVYEQDGELGFISFDQG